MNTFFKFTFQTLETFLEEVSLKILFILKKDFLKKNITNTLISITKNNFILFYSNKNYSLKFIFNIFKLNKNYSFKINFSKTKFFKRPF